MNTFDFAVYLPVRNSRVIVDMNPSAWAFPKKSMKKTKKLKNVLLSFVLNLKAKRAIKLTLTFSIVSSVILGFVVRYCCK